MTETSTQRLPDGPGPHEPETLTTDAALAQQARDLRTMMIERFEAEGDDTLAHMAYCYTLSAAVLAWVHAMEAEAQVDRAQHELLETTQQEVKRLRAYLAEVKRPLEAEMERLNRRVMALNLLLAQATAVLTAATKINPYGSSENAAVRDAAKAFLDMSRKAMPA